MRRGCLPAPQRMTFEHGSGAQTQAADESRCVFVFTQRRRSREKKAPKTSEDKGLQPAVRCVVFSRRGSCGGGVRL